MDAGDDLAALVERFRKLPVPDQRVVLDRLGDLAPLLVAETAPVVPGVSPGLAALAAGDASLPPKVREALRRAIALATQSARGMASGRETGKAL